MVWKDSFLILVVTSHLVRVHRDVLHLAGVGVVEQLGDADLIFLAAARGLGDVLPKDEQAGDEGDPEKKLFDGRIQAYFLVVNRGDYGAAEVCPGLETLDVSRSGR